MSWKWKGKSVFILQGLSPAPWPLLHRLCSLRFVIVRGVQRCQGHLSHRLCHHYIEIKAHDANIPAEITRDDVVDVKAAKIVRKTCGGLDGVIPHVDHEQIVCTFWDELPYSPALAALAERDVDNVMIVCTQKRVHEG